MSFISGKFFLKILVVLSIPSVVCLFFLFNYISKQQGSALSSEPAGECECKNAQSEIESLKKQLSTTNDFTLEIENLKKSLQEKDAHCETIKSQIPPDPTPCPSSESILTSKLRIPRIKSRYSLIEFFESEGFTKGAEVGVNYSWFAQKNLALFKSCKKYLLVDPWIKQSVIKDGVNDEMNVQDEKYNNAVGLKKRFSCVEVIRDFSVDAANQVEDNSLDFIYIDARHNYLSLIEDLVAWFPKIRVGGVLSGHDYLDQCGLSKKARADGKGSFWAEMSDLTIQKDGKAVKGAVDDFCKLYDFQLMITEIDNWKGSPYNSWYFRKWKNVDVSFDDFKEDLKGLENNEENVKYVNSLKCKNKGSLLPSFD